MNERNDVVERALGYPYGVPPGPFVQLGHQTLDSDALEIDREARTPVLAYGSNAAPQVLSRKLALSDQPVLVVPARLAELDVVYSAHISPYGAVPATLQRSPGTEVRVHVIYMTEAQIGVISATEPNYEPRLLEDIECRLEEGEELTEISAYISRHGCLLIDGSEVALAAVAATGRTLTAMSETAVMERVRSTLCPADSLETFVLANVTDPALSQARTARLPRRSPSPA
ncbi:MAG TPA: hypothetical protein VFS48_01085 [Solirubrobacterales bacterium]|nr:hypothetical protein [Solirubrobacterales bacterium]